MQAFKSIVIKASGLLNLVSYFALVILMLLITANVILRSLFTAPILGAYDWTGFLTTLIIGCGLAYCALQNGHIEISFFTDMIGRRTRRVIEKLGQILSLLVLLLYTVALFSLGGRLMRAGEVSVTTKTPVYPFVFFMSICFIIFALAVLIKILDLDENQPAYKNEPEDSFDEPADDKQRIVQPDKDHHTTDNQAVIKQLTNQQTTRPDEADKRHDRMQSGSVNEAKKEEAEHES